jgi:hypothetical protein
VTDVNGNTGTLSNPNWTTNAVTEVSSEGVTKQTPPQTLARSLDKLRRLRLTMTHRDVYAWMIWSLRCRWMSS